MPNPPTPPPVRPPPPAAVATAGVSRGTSPYPTSSLGPALEAPLRDACAGRLSPIRWFRSDWQRGGGSTGFATYAADDGPIDAVVKVPVGPAELWWTAAISGHAHSPDSPLAHSGPAADPDPSRPTPRVLAAGDSLGGWDLGWMILERLPGLPIGARLDSRGIEDMLRALADWHDRAEAVAVRLPPQLSRAPAQRPLALNWEEALRASREVIQHAGPRLPSAQRWKHTVHDVQKHLPQLLRRWESRPLNTWCHGDLHPGNAMRRVPHAEGRTTRDALGTAVLLDLALVHRGHWLEDVLYFERIYWGRADLLRGVNLVSALARIRRERGHDDHEDYGMLAGTRRVLAAAAAPGLMEREGNHKYLAYALELIPRLLPMVGH